jgi:hypothetical protein
MFIFLDGLVGLRCHERDSADLLALTSEATSSLHSSSFLPAL